MFPSAGRTLRWSCPILVLSATGAACNSPDASFGAGTDAGIGGVGAGAGGAGAGTAGASGASLGGTAGQAGCPTGWGDCDGSPANGCETNTSSSPQHCGQCDAPCPGQEICSIGVCCAAGTANCDGLSSNGCEASWLDDGQHCGNCTTVCEPSHFCKSGVCAACPAGTYDCDRSGATVCESSEECTAVVNCPPDAWEDNETLWFTLEMPAGAKKLDPTNNVWVVSQSRKSSYFPGFTTIKDVDVFYVEVEADSTAHPRWDITLENLQNGATYELDTYYGCLKTGVPLSLANTASCSPGGSVGSWYHCANELGAPAGQQWWGIDCPGGGAGSDNGILQIRLRMVNPPATLTCDTYTLTVQVQPQ
jgi:hypothetical protein